MALGSGEIENRQREVDVVIVGGGFGGLGMAIQLLKNGRDNFVLLEKEKEVGGTWRDNTYPGCACDVQSHLYSFSFAPKADWTQRYAPWNEIQDYILDTTEKYGVRRYTEFGQEVISADFSASTGRWLIRTRAGLVFSAKYWVLASGPLHFPAIPNIKGLGDFKGEIFHSARWNHKYDLTNKRVVSIGTGGSAIQYVPEIAPKVKHLHVMQRSPAWVIPRDMRTYWALEKLIFQFLPGMRWLHRARLYWTNESRLWPILNPRLARVLSKVASLMIWRQVDDPAVRRKLTPKFAIGCKRVLISNAYFPTFNRPNVDLVTDDITEVRSDSVITADGTERKADCIILGTGFHVDPRTYMRDFELTGLPGRELGKDWKNGAEAYLGVAVSGYPNFFQLVGPNTGLGHNSILFMIEAQIHYILECMKETEKQGAAYLDVKPNIQRQFNKQVQSQFPRTVWGSGCQSWYNQTDGKNIAIWPFSTWRYWLRTRKVNPEEYRFERVEPGQATSKISAQSATV